MAYVQLFSHVSLAGNAIASEQFVRIIYAPTRVHEVFKDSPTIQRMRETHEIRTTTSQQLSALQQMRTDIVKSKAAEAERLAQLSPALLIQEFPNDTKQLALIPPDRPRVEQPNTAHPALDTKQLQKAFGVSYSQALKLKWGLNPSGVIDPGESHWAERETAKYAAIKRIMDRFENGLVKKFGKTESDLQTEIERTQIHLDQIEKVRVNIRQATPVGAGGTKAFVSQRAASIAMKPVRN